MCNQVVIMNIRDYAILVWQKRESEGGEGKRESRVFYGKLKTMMSVYLTKLFAW